MRSMLFFAVWAPGVALADAIDLPPDDCPAGSVGQSSHAGTWCEAQTCAPGATCEEGTCQPHGLCVLTETRPCGGRPAPGYENCTFVAHEALGPCDSQDDCARGTCEVVDRCVKSSSFGASCGCTQLPTNRLAFGLGVGALLALVGGRRWRSRLEAR
jgi:hypothetical protein